MINYYFKYKDDVFRFVLSIVKNTCLAEDITQECFLKLIENFNDIREKSKIKYWLFTTAKNLCITLLKESNKLTLGEFLENISTENNIGYLELISTLSDEEQQLVSLKIIGKFKWKEIAKMYDCSEEAVKKRYQRALTKIKNQLRRAQNEKNRETIN